MNKIKIYKTKPDDPDNSSANLSIELDGKPLDDVVEFNYRVVGGEMPLVTITMVAQPEIEHLADVNIQNIPPNPPQDPNDTPVQF